MTNTNAPFGFKQTMGTSSAPTYENFEFSNDGSEYPKKLTPMEAELQPSEAGERFLGVNCANPECRKIMSIMGTWSVDASEDGQIAMRPVAQPMICPYCKTEATYLPQQVRQFVVQAPVWRSRT
jgi:hypothetical protein